MVYMGSVRLRTARIKNRGGLKASIMDIVLYEDL